MNADRRTDVVVIHSRAASVWLGAAQAFSAAPGSPVAVPGATEAAVGDLDGDRRGELLAVCPMQNRLVVVTSPR